jgi:3-hydroxyisobutyrate dehydrogenase-like beta-hydroxyacid dehydrogenase
MGNDRRERQVPQCENDQATPVPRAGVIGLGGIGHGLATSLVQAGVTVAVCDLRQEATAPFREVARVAATPSDLAAHSDVVLVSVFNDQQVRAVLGGPDGVFAGAAPGTAVVILSTIPTSTVIDMRAEGAPHGVTVVDCGVSGGPDAASSGEWVCMIGGSAEEVDRVRPVLDVISCLVLHMGPPGAGLAAKLARNLITYGAWYAAFEAQQLAEAAGIDLVKLGQATRESDKRIGGASRLMFRDTTGPWPEDTDAGLLGAMRAASDMAHKDLVTILEFGAQLGVALPMGELAERRCNRVFGFPDA